MCDKKRKKKKGEGKREREGKKRRRKGALYYKENILIDCSTAYAESRLS